MATEWDNIIGHDWAVDVLRSAIEYDRIGQAYLITGPEQVGKTTLAVTFAQALNCQSAESTARPCGTCRSCTLIAAGRHPDVQLIEPEISSRGKASIKIETIRELQRGLQLAPYEGRYKVAIISTFDAANQNAANAFLKTLEEPPEHVILILTATEADVLLDTIRSRCRVVGIRPIPTPAIRHALTTRWGITADDADKLAHLADGRLGWAVTAATHPDLLVMRQTQLATLQEILAGNRVARFQSADQLAGKPESLPVLLQLWISWWRDVLLLATGDQSDALTNIDYLGQLATLAHRLMPDEALIALNATKNALWQLERNANTRLVLENLFLKWPNATEIVLG